ncbi:D-alanyl-D-alanine carboxypeptidase [Aquamicrobium sp. LC103]|uniref:D-alanyl-D-alanine carboxypeptidase n=1 Tax=Aquamicrobium sp. LC103 TaxID=1120658 RepID=UPI00063EA290|nr:D-alanyl-D-alanine carboxypeptidase [Aquamicrobium sp. LC103]TKT76948.1 D-alanyl-D-alanine carboxypeptidase [Aquamicrobium sp. LC103]
MGVIVRQVWAGFFSRIPYSSKSLLVMLMALAIAAGNAGQASANPRYAAYVMDAKTGQVLFQSNGNDRRYPASLTKMMTLYLVFEAMNAGRINKNTRIRVSANAAAEPPTKIGLKAGSTITVENAILALITRSANDMATALGEHLGGSEANFAKMMTAKARQLGMDSTQFRNAHGLPNNAQYTTARDMAILGIALREHFPRQYPYFSTTSFTLGKTRYNNHNRLLNRVEGVDGIKTGYIRASGFNLVTSVQNNGRSVVAVVMGGQSAKSRDDHMAALIREYLPKASRGGGGQLIASRTLTPSTAVAASAVALPKRNIPTPDFRPQDEIGQIAVAAYAQEPAAARFAPPVPIPSPVVAASEAIEAATPIDPVQTASTTRPSAGWVIQVASSPSEREAKAFLESTTQKASGLLANATAFTETFDNKGTTFFRARFGGFGSKNEAWNACGALKKKKIDCYAVQL